MPANHKLKDTMERILEKEQPRVKRLKHTFYENLGSAFDDTTDFVDRHSTALALYKLWCMEHAKGRYNVGVEPHRIYDADGKLIDYAFWLVISFDFSGDAMLSRISWPELQRYPEGEKRRGRGRSAS